MPVIQIDTNFEDKDIPDDFEVKLHRFLAPLMGKDISVGYCVY